MRNMKKRILGLFVLLTFTFSTVLGGAIPAAAAAATTTPTTGATQETNSTNSLPTYKSYLGKYQSSQSPDAAVNVNLTQFSASNGYAKVVQNIGGRNGSCVETTENGNISWQVNIPEDGLYNVNLTYYPEAGKGASIVRKFYVDGAVPYQEANNLTFTRSFVNATEIKKDRNGNDIRPSQVEKAGWMTVDFSDSLGYYTDPLQFYFSKGTHTIKLESVREPLTIGELKIYKSTAAKSYKEVASGYSSAGYTKYTGTPVKVQGEQAEVKSDSMLYPVSDTSSSATEPSSYKSVLLNTIGGNKWQTCGQWLEWKVSVPKSGLYKLGIKARQNVVAGQPSYRKIYIDGKLPFAEMNQVKFPYNTHWQMITLGTDQSPDMIYLTAGEHTIKMEATLGELAPLVQNVNDTISTLNSIYRDFLIVIGQSADVNRDYRFDTLLPNDLKALVEQSKKLKEIYDEYQKISSIGGSQSQILLNLAQQCYKMGTDPDVIASKFSDFSNNISNLGTWMTTAQTQPVEIDYIVLSAPDQKFQSTASGFFSNFAFSLQQFIATFYVDYSAIGTSSASSDSVKVWIASGRDQANALSQLISNNFTSKSGIPVNLQLVSAGVLMMATLANKGPDIALSQGQSDPMNFAIRGAVVDISKFKDYNEVAKRFQPSAMAPLTFQGHVYGLPETQSFPMMFYRTDILNQLHLSVPQTWDDVIAMLPVLQKRNLNFGMPVPYNTTGSGVGLPVYAMFLYQNGGSFYNTSGSKSTISSEAGINAFFTWTSLYTNYTLPTQYDFNTRFRSGIIPIGIADYGTFNSLSVFAPELNGVWKFAPVPGVRKADGTIDRSVASSITATVMMSNTKNKQNAWEFMKWWTSANTQEIYGRELESIMGSAARYQTANIEALYQIPWSTQDFNTLMEQWKWTKGIPEVPGSYMTPRYIDFAFKQVVLSSAHDPAKVLMAEEKQIDQELTAKRQEFGITDSGK